MSAGSLRGLAGRVLGSTLRAVIRLVDDGALLQELQVEALKGQVLDGVERFQEYGLTSRPRTGAEALLLHLGASADHPVVVAVGDRENRPTGLAEGEVQLYSLHGQAVHLKEDGSIELRAGQSRIELAANGEVTIEGTAIHFQEA